MYVAFLMIIIVIFCFRVCKDRINTRKYDEEERFDREASYDFYSHVTDRMLEQEVEQEFFDNPLETVRYLNSELNNIMGTDIIYVSDNILDAKNSIINLRNLYIYLKMSENGKLPWCGTIGAMEFWNCITQTISYELYEPIAWHIQERLRENGVDVTAYVRKGESRYSLPEIVWDKCDPSARMTGRPVQNI